MFKAQESITIIVKSEDLEYSNKKKSNQPTKGYKGQIKLHKK